MLIFQGSSFTPRPHSQPPDPPSVFRTPQQLLIIFTAVNTRELVFFLYSWKSTYHTRGKKKFFPTFWWVFKIERKGWKFFFSALWSFICGEKNLLIFKFFLFSHKLPAVQVRAGREEKTYWTNTKFSKWIVSHIRFRHKSKICDVSLFIYTHHYTHTSPSPFWIKLQFAFSQQQAHH